MITKLLVRKDMSLEDVIEYVKEFFDEIIKSDKKQESELIIIAIEYYYIGKVLCDITSLCVNKKGDLIRINQPLTDDDDGMIYARKIINDVDEKTMDRFFWSEDTVSIRQWYDDYKLKDAIIEDLATTYLT
ncbi:MAG: hypothetical protein PHU05_05010 [Bacilli bacterium]|nr:hypothetical protein [Bacilli bacterium]